MAYGAAQEMDGFTASGIHKAHEHLERAMDALLLYGREMRENGALLCANEQNLVALIRENIEDWCDQDMLRVVRGG